MVVVNDVDVFERTSAALTRNRRHRITSAGNDSTRFPSMCSGQRTRIMGWDVR